MITLDIIIERLQGKLKKDWAVAYCPVCQTPGDRDDEACLLIKTDLTVCKCKNNGCVSGDINQLLGLLGLPLIEKEQPDLFDRTKLRRWQEQFDSTTLDTASLLWNKELCKCLGIGWTGKFFAIPIYKAGALTQVWKFAPGKAYNERYKQCVATDDGGSVFPDAEVRGHFAGEDLWITDNYADTIALLSAGEAALCAGGKNRWGENEVRLVLGLNPSRLIVAAPANKYGDSFCKTIRKLFGNTLPIRELHTGLGRPDITSALRDGADPAHMKENYQRIGTPEEEEVGPPEAVELVNMHTCVNRRATVTVTVRGKYSAPYFIPSRFRIECPESSDKVCPHCDYHNGYLMVVPESEYPSLVGVPIEKMEARLKRIVNPPARCPKLTPVVEKEDIIVMEECRVRPPYDTRASDEANIERRAFVVGTGLIPNNNYTLTGLVVPHAETQEICLVATEREDASVSIREDALCPFTEGKNIDQLLLDLAYNVTHIYDRPRLHLWVLLTLFSPMAVRLNGVRMRTYMETLLLGDTQTGKSQTAEAVFRHYGVGRKIDSAQATVAGVLGGVSEAEKGRKFVTPGILAESDGRIVMFEEIGCLAEGILKSMREARSSGVIEIGKIEKASYSARCRVLATANPNSGRRTMASYNHGCEAIFSILSDPADMRRFDFLHVVQADEAVNIYRPSSVPALAYSSEDARKHLSWAWGLTEENIHFEAGFETRLKKRAIHLGLSGHESMPILTPTNAQERLLKLSCAFAALRASCTADRKGLVVTAADLDVAECLINEEYNQPPTGYFDYCSERRAEEQINDSAILFKRFRQLDQPRETAQMLKNSINFASLSDLQFSLALSNDIIAVKHLIAALLQQNCIKRINKLVVKTPAFVEWLKVNSDTMPDLKSERMS